MNMVASNQRATAGKPPGRYRLRDQTRKALFCEWRKVAPELDYPGVESDDEARHLFTRQTLRLDSGLRGNDGARVSWKNLSEGQGKRLLRAMRERSGSGPNHRSILIARLAQELFGVAWDRMLSERLYLRFQIRDLKDLTPRDAHAEIEELMSRIARRDGVEIEAVRARFRRQERKGC